MVNYLLDATDSIPLFLQYMLLGAYYTGMEKENIYNPINAIPLKNL
jgi:hypothetical protein